MAYSSWRGVVGTIKPTMRPGSYEELVRLLPDGIGVIPLFVSGRRPLIDDVDQALKAYEAKVEEMVRAEVDLIHAEGAATFMQLGPEEEARRVAAWEAKYKIPVFTAAQNQVRALKALGVKNVVGVTYASGNFNAIFSRYLTDCGLNVKAMDGISVDWEDVSKISPEQVYVQAKRSFLKNPGGDGIYLQGSDWRILTAVEMLEQDLQVPVVHSVAARSWEIQRRLHVRQPVKGRGRLLRDMPQPKD
jgi:maleate isomerase